MARRKKPDPTATSTRLTLASNLEALREHFGVSGRQFFGEEFLNVPAETGRRALKGLKAIDVDTLDKIASALHLEAWQLLVPGLDPKNLPTHVPASVRSSMDELLTRMTVAKTMP
jgi:hypothetical protein